jgi:hypothetical protein
VPLLALLALQANRGQHIAGRKLKNQTDLPRTDKERPVPRLSIVIPCLGGAAEFDGTLVSILQNRPADCEVLVVHTEPYNDPYSLRGEVRFVEAQESLVGLLNLAVEAAQGEVLHIVGCGLEVIENWTEAALEHFRDPEVAAVSPAILKLDRQTLVAAGVYWSLGGARRVVTDSRVIARGSGRLRSRIHGPTLAAAFYRRDVIAALGGFDAQVGEQLADVSVALDLQALGRLNVCEPASRLLEVGQIHSNLCSGFAAGRAAERLFWRHAHHRGITASLAMHAGSIAAELIFEQPSRFLGSLAGRGLASLEIGAAARHEQRLAAASDRLKELSELRATIRKATAPVKERRRAA